MAILTASFIPFIIITTLIVIHELGHFMAAALLNVEVNKIYLYPLGGISKFFLPLNASSLTELFILVSGPIFQFIARAILLILLPKYNDLINIYHYGILCFNLLPIYPLDGGKLLHLTLATILPYRKSLTLTIFISYLTIILLLLTNISSMKINTIILIVFLIVKVYIEQNKINYIYEKFILERYLTNYKFKRSKLISNEKNFYKSNRHIIKQHKNYILEQDYLIKKYQKNQKIS